MYSATKAIQLSIYKFIAKFWNRRSLVIFKNISIQDILEVTDT